MRTFFTHSLVSPLPSLTHSFSLLSNPKPSPSLSPNSLSFSVDLFFLPLFFFYAPFVSHPPISLSRPPHQPTTAPQPATRIFFGADRNRGSSSKANLFIFSHSLSRVYFHVHQTLGKYSLNGATRMHPPLTLHKHPMCAEIIEQFQKCHLDHPIAKFVGECTDLKIKLDRCFRQEKSLKRKANFEESKKLKERLQAYRKETAERSPEERKFMQA